MKGAIYGKIAIAIVIAAVLGSLISMDERAGIWLIGVVLGAGGLVLLLSLVLQIKNAVIHPAHRLYARDFYLKFMATLMGFFLVLGTLLYLYVFYTIGHDQELEKELEHKVLFSNAEYLLRSLICSLDLFMLDVDTNILDRLDRHPVLKGWMAIQAVLSFACTVTLLVGLVYSRLRAYFRLNYATRISNSKNHLYLFWGDNEPSELLIRDIVRHDAKAIAIIIDEANVKEEDNNEWEGIVGLITHKHDVFKKAKRIHAHVAIAGQQLAAIDHDITDREDFDAFGYLGLSRIRKFISSLKDTHDPQLHIFFMGEDEEQNIRNIITLAKDTTIMNVAGRSDLYHRIYCHARYNGPNRVIQDVALKKRLNIKIIDSSHLAVELLKLNPDCHPVNVVTTSDRELATVGYPLKTLIVGFGEVGRDAFRFLYEFGAFPDSGDPNRRSPFECVIVDKDINKIKGTFMASMPAIFTYDEAEKKLKSDCVRFVNADIYGSDFYEEALIRDNFLENVNYVVISIGDNDEAIALATRLFNRIRKVRDDVSNLRIFVRCTDDSKIEGIRKIADHYNYGYGDGNRERNRPVIRIFGQPEKTYTYEMVVSDRLIEKGKRFQEAYRKLSREGKSWDERHRELSGKVPPDIESLRRLRRQESQDIANALHAGTKIILLKEAMLKLCRRHGRLPDWYTFYLEYFNQDGTVRMEGSRGNIRYPGLSEEENKIILHLAMLEHLRWNAAHELMGYVFKEDGNNCNERTMTHNCLCEWRFLDGQSDRIIDWQCDYKKYDFCVVDTTVSLSRDALLSTREHYFYNIKTT